MSRPSMTDLPVEVMEEIVDAAPLEVRLSLSRVSKFLNILAIRTIYRNISLVVPSLVVLCCRTLTTNSNAAAAVRTFSISYTLTEPFNANYHTSFYSLIGKALNALVNIQDLKLLVTDPNFILPLNHCTLPTLRRFECYLALTNSLIFFLNRHPDLTYLQISTSEDLSRSLPIDSVPEIILPKLEYFVGNSECISALTCDAPLRAAFLCWDAVDSTPQDAIMALGRSSGHSINVLTCRRRSWNLDLLQLVSEWLPSLYVLTLTNLLVVDSSLSPVYRDAVAKMLPRFKNLSRLYIHCVDIFEMDGVQCSLDDDWLTVMAWGAACPSLKECILPHSNSLRWRRFSDTLWIPDLSQERASLWITQILQTKHEPYWSNVGIGIENAIKYNRDTTIASPFTKIEALLKKLPQIAES